MAEVGILGQVAKVPLLDRRLDEAQRLGFQKAFIAPATAQEKAKIKTMAVTELLDLPDLSLKLR